LTAYKKSLAPYQIVPSPPLRLTL